MTPNEKDFVKNIRDYFDLDLREIDEERIVLYLNEYVDSIPKPPIPMPRKEIIYKERVVVKYVDRNKVERAIFTDDELYKQVELFCEKKCINISDFLPPKRKGRNHKTSRQIVPLRCEFSQLMETLGVRRKQLQNLFKVHHTNIIYYIRPEKKVRRTA